MDRDVLQGYLAEGLSLERIAEHVACHPSTVGYWIAKHGLEAAHRDLHLSKGGVAKETLEKLVNDGLTIAEIASSLGLAESSVRYWLGKYGLRTRRACRVYRGPDRPHRIWRECERHGIAEFVAVGSERRYRCVRCRSEHVAARRRRAKKILVEEAGGRCRLCGYDRYHGALQFHHLDPSTKKFSLSVKGVTRSLDSLRLEAAKCALLCSNCHAEVEAGILTLA